MPPKKKQQKSAFFFFMCDFKQRQEAKGQIFPGGFSDIPAACGEEWQKMTPQQKGPYEARAKNARIKDGMTEMKYTSQGVPITLIEREAKRKQEFEDNMNDYIKVTINMCETRDSLINKRFYFIHVNWLCREVKPNGEGDFVPAEVALSEFSLQYGVRNIYHEIIDIDVPKGYTFEAALHSEETHKIGIHHPGGESNFNVMYQKLKDFLSPETIGEEFPPLYTTRALMEIVPGFLSRVAKVAGRAVDIFRVYSIETLFFLIRNAAASKVNGEATSAGFPTLALAASQIQKDRFDRTPGICCEYHTEMEESSIHCSRSVVVRWAYIICDFCCADLEIEVIPGQHCPYNTDVESFRESKQSLIREALSYSSRNENPRGLASMTGVTEEHRIRTSERTYKEEMARRQNSRPLEIIDHSKLKNSDTREVKSNPLPAPTTGTSYSDFTRKNVERPLRLPKTKMRNSRAEAACPYSRPNSSYAMMGAESEKVPNMDEMNFPAIGGGRGVGMRKISDNDFPPIGRGRGLPFGK